MNYLSNLKKEIMRLINNATFTFALSFLACKRDVSQPPAQRDSAEVLIGRRGNNSYFLRQEGGRDNRVLEPNEPISIMIRTSDGAETTAQGPTAWRMLPLFGLSNFRGRCRSRAGGTTGTCALYRVNERGERVNVIHEYVAQFTAERDRSPTVDGARHTSDRLPPILTYVDSYESPIIPSHAELRDLMVRHLIKNRPNLSSGGNYDYFIEAVNAYARLVRTRSRDTEATDASVSRRAIYLSLLDILRSQIRDQDIEGVGHTLDTMTDLISRGGISRDEKDLLKRVALPFITGELQPDIRQYDSFFLAYVARGLSIPSQTDSFDFQAR